MLAALRMVRIERAVRPFAPIIFPMSVSATRSPTTVPVSDSPISTLTEALSSTNEQAMKWIRESLHKFCVHSLID